MKTVELTLHVPDALHEWLIAELADLDFEAFEEDDDQVRAYIPAARWTDVAREHVERWLAAHELRAPLSERVYEPQNWNARWEKSIEPVTIGPFLIKPTWADAPPEASKRVVLEIDPKMSFGTGYHESTRLVLRLLPGLIEPGDRVLDAGTGTGILAIAALKLGAASAVAFDTDHWAQENAVENFYLNGVADRTAFRSGSIHTVPESDFDVVLANINRNALLDMMSALAERTRPGGHLILAGLLHSDGDRMRDALAAHGFTPVHEAFENEWWAVIARRDEEENAEGRVAA